MNAAVSKTRDGKFRALCICPGQIFGSRKRFFDMVERNSGRQPRDRAERSLTARSRPEPHDPSLGWREFGAESGGDSAPETGATHLSAFETPAEQSRARRIARRRTSAGPATVSRDATSASPRSRQHQARRRGRRVGPARDVERCGRSGDELPRARHHGRRAERAPEDARRASPRFTG